MSSLHKRNEKSRTTINVKFDYIFMRLSTISWMQSGNLAKGSSPNMNSNNRDKGLQILDMECVERCKTAFQSNEK